MNNIRSAAPVRRIARTLRPLMLALVTAVTFAGLVAYAPLPAAANASSALPSQQPLANIGAGYALPGSDPFIRSELYFGTNRSEQPPVSDEEWEGFLDNQITPRFPDGLTVLKGYGQFRNSSGVTIEERSIVLILLYPVETRAESSVKIEEIRDLYEESFEQESVLRVDDRLPARVSF
jgi:hypothetical protein